MHIMPAAITKPISKGVNRVWEWICSKMKEERGITTYQQDWVFTTAIHPKPPTSHLAAHGGIQSRAHPSCLPWLSSDSCYSQGNLFKIILSQILWKRAGYSYSTKITLCRWSMKSNTWRNFVLQPNSLLRQLLRNVLYGWFLFSSLCFLVFSKFSTLRKTLLKCSFYCPDWKKKIYGAEQCKTSSLITQKLRIHHFWHSSLPTQENKKWALRM